MRLKHRDDITADDLPFIDSASCAVFKIEHARHDPFGSGALSHITNLDFMLRADDGFYGLSTSYDHGGHDDRRLARLLSRVERYDVVLVRDRFNPPLSPPFRWTADVGHPNGGTWEIHERIPPPSLQRLLHNITHGRLGNATAAHTAPAQEQPEPPAQTKAAAAPRVATHDIALDVRHEHFQSLNGHLPIKDGTRYTLTTDQNTVRKGVVQNGRVEEKDLEMSSSYTLTFVKPT